MNKFNALLITLQIFSLFIQLSKQNTCGITTMISKEENIDPNQYFKLQIDTQDKIKKQQFSLSGYIFLNSISQEITQLLNISMQPDEGEYFFEKTLQNFLIVTYQQNSKNSKMIIYLAENHNSWQLKEINIQLPLNKWIFLGTSLNKELKKFKFLIHYNDDDNKEISKLEEFEFNFPAFYLREKLDLYIGTIPFYQDNQPTLFYPNTIKGKVKQFKIMFEYFEDLNFLMYFSGAQQNLLKFDFTQYLREIMEQKIVMSSTESDNKLLMIGNINTDQKGLILQGQTQFLLLYPLKNDQEEIWTPTFNLKFSFENPLQKINLIRIKTDNNDVFNFIIQPKKNSKQHTLVFINKKDSLTYNFDLLFSEKIIYTLNISFFIYKNNFRLVVNNQQSLIFNYVIKSFEDLNLLEIQGKNTGRIFFYQFNILPSAGVLIYNKLKKNSQCIQNCNLLDTLSYQQQCLECDNNMVVYQNQCQKYCEYGNFNKMGVCKKCPDKHCSQLKARTPLQIQKNKNEFYIKKQGKIYPENNDYFDMKIPGMINGQDYELDWFKIDQNRQKVIIKWIGDVKVNQTIMFKFKGEKFYDENLNQYPTQYFLFQVQESDLQLILQNDNVSKSEGNFFMKYYNKFKDQFKKIFEKEKENESQILEDNSKSLESQQLLLQPLVYTYDSIDRQKSFEKQIEEQKFTYNPKQQNLNKIRMVKKIIKKSQVKKYVQKEFLIIINSTTKILFLIVACCIFIGVFIELFFKNQTLLFHFIITTILFIQQYTFFFFYEINFPSSMQLLIGLLNKYTIQTQNIFSNFFNSKSVLEIFYQNQNENSKQISYFKLLLENMSLIILIHIVLFLFWILISIIYSIYSYKLKKSMKKKDISDQQVNLQLKKSFFKKFAGYFLKKILITVILILLIQTIVFSFMNSNNLSFKNWYDWISIVLSIGYFILIFFLIISLETLSFNYKGFSYLHRTYGKNIDLYQVMLFYFAIQTIIYVCFGCYPKVSSIINTILLIIFIIFASVFYSKKKFKFKILFLLNFILSLCLHILLIILIFVNFDKKIKFYLGYVMVVIFQLLILYNSFIIIIYFLIFLKDFFKKKKYQERKYQPINIHSPNKNNGIQIEEENRLKQEIQRLQKEIDDSRQNSKTSESESIKSLSNEEHINQNSQEEIQIKEKN